MKKVWGKSALLTASLLLSFSIGVNAATINEKVSAILSKDVSVTLNDTKIPLKDGAGDAVYPLVYNGSTYLPVRSVAELTGMSIDWNPTSRTVALRGAASTTTPVVSEDPYKDAANFGKTTLLQLRSVTNAITYTKGNYANSGFSVSMDKTVLTDSAGKTAAFGFVAKDSNANSHDIANTDKEDMNWYSGINVKVPTGATKIKGYIKGPTGKDIGRDNVPRLVLINDSKVAFLDVKVKMDDNDVYTYFEADLGSTKTVQIRVSTSVGTLQNIILADVVFE